MSKKYFAQILLEVELNSQDRITAEIEARVFSERLQINADDNWNKKVELINTHIITDPSDEDFLESYIEHKGELYIAID